MSAPNKPDTPDKARAHARALELDLDLDEVDAVARHDDDGDDSAERPTVSPPFDVDAFAREGAEAMRSDFPVRGPSPTLTDEAELEDARKRSVLTTPPSTPPSRGVTPLSVAGAAALPPSEPKTDSRADTPAVIHESDREPATRVARASGTLLLLANSRQSSMIPPAERRANAWSSIDRGWGADGEDEAPTSQGPALDEENTEVSSPSERPTTRVEEPPDTPLPPASGQAGSLAPASKRSPTLRPGAHTAPTPPAHKPLLTRRATRVWTSDTSSVLPAPIPSPLPPSSGSANEAHATDDADGSIDVTVATTSSVAPPAQRHPFVDSAAGPSPTSETETPSPAGRDQPKVTPFALPRLGATEDEVTLAGAVASTVSSAPPTRKPEADPNQEMRERFSLGDYTGALVIAEGILEDSSDVGASRDVSEAREYAESCRSVLQQMYTARIGPLDRVPVVMVPRDQLRWLSIDHRAGFVLSHVDGISSLEMILDVSGMPPLDTLRILCELNQQRIISFR